MRSSRAGNGRFPSSSFMIRQCNCRGLDQQLVQIPIVISSHDELVMPPKRNFISSITHGPGSAAFKCFNAAMAVFKEVWSSQVHGRRETWYLVAFN